MKILFEIFRSLRCINCTYHCSENLGYTYCCHGRLDTNPKDPHYPKINKKCCPKDYPLSAYLRNLAGVWNGSHKITLDLEEKRISKIESTSYPNMIGSCGGQYPVDYA